MVAPLGMHVSMEAKEKILKGEYVDIWLLISVDHLTVNKERVCDKTEVKKLKVAKTFGNWLQAFAILAVLLVDINHKRLQIFLFTWIPFTRLINWTGDWLGGVTMRSSDAAWPCPLMLDGRPKRQTFGYNSCLQRSLILPFCHPPPLAALSTRQRAVERAFVDSSMKGTAVFTLRVNSSMSVPFVGAPIPRCDALSRVRPWAPMLHPGHICLQVS